MDYSKIAFKDDFEAYNDTCEICGSEDMCAVGYNKRKDMLKFECPECEAVIVEDGDGDTTIVKGTPRQWGKHLAENLSFPFEAVVIEQDCFGLFGFKKPSRVRFNDILMVTSVDYENNLNVVYVAALKGKKKHSVALMDLEPTDKSSPNAKLLKNYGSWIGERIL